MSSAVPPELPIDRLTFAAKIDFVKVSNRGLKVPIPRLEGRAIWARPKKNDPNWVLTIHDPTRGDVLKVIEAYGDPMVMELEVAVDLTPRPEHQGEGHAGLLDVTYQAVAARFRPEDEALWAYGKRGAVSGRGMPIEPLERRFARKGQQLIYGHNGEFMQAKLYPKILDQKMLLPESEHRVRMELRMCRGACMDERLGLDRLSDLLGYPYRATFTKHIRVISEPRVRLLRGLTGAEHTKRTKKMWRAWRTAGVAKFAISPDLPPDSCPVSIRAIKARQRVQLSYSEYRLMRDQVANAKIGSALMNLQRRMMKAP